MNGTGRHVLVVGGGASGMAAAFFAARAGADTEIFEKNDKLGRKLYITGKGRCNVTNASGPDTFFEQVVSNPRFLYSAVSHFGSGDVMDWIERLGTPLKTERGSRVFPVSDHASDIIKALEYGLSEQGVRVHLGSEVAGILIRDRKAAGIRLKNGTFVPGDAVILATGGLSYPLTGSTGDGYRFAQDAGHTVTALRPALVPLTVKEPWIGEVQGLSLRNVRMTIPYGKKKVFSEFGELLFTADGISGPLGLRASSVIGRMLEEGPLSGSIELKTALTVEQLDAKLLRLFEETPNKAFRNVIRPLLPMSLVPVMVALSGVPGEKPVHDITKEERRTFLTLLKSLPVTFTGTHGYAEAVITQGGVPVREIIPGTMGSRICKDLYFAGELLDVDAFTGGFNLQIAWSTGFCAGTSAAADGMDKEVL